MGGLGLLDDRRHGVVGGGLLCVGHFVFFLGVCDYSWKLFDGLVDGFVFVYVCDAMRCAAMRCDVNT